MILINHRTAKRNMETNLNYKQNMARFRSSSLAGKFFSNFSFGKTEDFHASAFAWS